MDITLTIVGIIAGIVTIAGVLVGIWFQFLNKGAGGSPQAGRDTQTSAKDVGAAATGPQAAAATTRGMAAARDIIINRPGMTDEERERFLRVEEQLAELQVRVAAPPEGSAPLETTALAAQATEKTERLLAEAIALQHEHKEREAIERLLTAYEIDMPSDAKAQLHNLLGNSFLNVSELEEAEGHYQQALTAAKEAGHRRGEAAALGNLGLVYRNQGDLARAEDHHRRALAISRDLGDRSFEAINLVNLGIIYDTQGAQRKAGDHFQQALVIHREVGNDLGLAASLGNLGIIYRVKGDLAKAEDHHQQALTIHREIKNRLGEAQDLGNLGTVYQEQGDLAKAEDHQQQSLAIHVEIGNRLDQANALGSLGNLYKIGGDFAKAKSHHEEAAAIQREIGNRLGEANALGNLGLLAAIRKDQDEACHQLRESLFIYDDIGAGGPGPKTVRAALEELGCDEDAGTAAESGPEAEPN